VRWPAFITGGGGRPSPLGPTVILSSAACRRRACWAWTKIVGGRAGMSSGRRRCAGRAHGEVSCHESRVTAEFSTEASR